MPPCELIAAAAAGNVLPPMLGRAMGAFIFLPPIGRGTGRFLPPKALYILPPLAGCLPPTAATPLEPSTPPD